MRDFKLLSSVRFLALSDIAQLRYCAQRDLYSAKTAKLRSEDPEWYERRAAGYMEDADKLESEAKNEGK